MLSRVGRALSSWAAFPLSIVAVRTASLVACPASIEAPYVFLGLDVLTLLPLSPMRGDRFMRVFITLLGVAALALGVKLLTEGHPGAAVIWIALPHVLAAVVALAWRPLASWRDPAVQAR